MKHILLVQLISSTDRFVYYGPGTNGTLFIDTVLNRQVKLSRKIRYISELIDWVIECESV